MGYQHQYADGTRIHYPLGKVVCVGRNYAEHARELGNTVPAEPLLFIKPGSSAVALQEGFAIPEGRGAVHHEVEIAVLIGKPLSRAPSDAKVQEAIAGYAPALDLTLRDLQSQLKAKGYPWEIAKAFDGSCVLAPFVSKDSFPDPTDIGLSLRVNGTLRQQGNSGDMIHPILPLIRYISGHFSLLPGDVVLSGTPSGVGPLKVGDELALALSGQPEFVGSVL